ncbi:hypothetical protein ScPMuIL_012337 [Solemya velum]
MQLYWWVLWMFLSTASLSYIGNGRSSNDIALDMEKIESFGKTASLIKALKQIAQRTHNCGNKDIPKLKKVLLANTSVTCNDGSPAGYYIRKSYGSSKWIVFLEGGWYCFDKGSCSSRWNSMPEFMSSMSWPETKEGTGILSRNPVENPYYFHSNMVYLPYCSSDSWTGTERGGNGQYSFMGSLIVEEVIKELLPKGLIRARKLVLAGSSAGGTGVLMNLDRIADVMASYAPSVEVRGIADSGWFLDNLPFRRKECVEAYDCAPTDGIKRGIELWKGRVPTSCMEIFSASEQWRCYFGYRIYPTIKTPVYIVQYQFDEAQITVDNVFDASDIQGDSQINKSQWEYLYELGLEVRKTLQNVSAVFAPACLSHELLTKSDWQTVSVDEVTLAESLYCWENRIDKKPCTEVTNKSTTSSLGSLDALLGDEPPTKEGKKKKKRRKKKNKDKERKRRQKGKRNKNRPQKDRSRWNRGKRSRSNRASRKGGCKHQLIDVCLLPQCNCACPKYINRLTGDEMNFFKLFIQYGIDKADLAELLSVDISTMNSMSYDTISDRVLKVIRQRS